MVDYVTGQPIHNNLQNKSTSKQMYSFPKAKRFFQFKSYSDRNQAIYNIPESKSQRATSFGYGKKYDITTINWNKERLKFKVPYYNLSHIRISSQPNAPKYTFGESREKFMKMLVDNQVMIPSMSITSPGPAMYDTRHNIGDGTPKYSFRDRIQYKGKAYRLNVPGPGRYGSVYMNKDGKYPLSTYRNTEQAPWSKNKARRFGEKRVATPGPGMYEVKGLINGKGKVYNSKFRSGTARSMGLKFRSIFDVHPRDITPGPGAYASFSEFGFYQDSQSESGSYRPINTEYGNFGNRPKLGHSRIQTSRSVRTTISKKSKV